MKLLLILIAALLPLSAHAKGAGHYSYNNGVKTTRIRLGWNERHEVKEHFQNSTKQMEARMNKIVKADEAIDKADIRLSEAATKRAVNAALRTIAVEKEVIEKVWAVGAETTLKKD